MKRIFILSIICCIHTILKGQSDSNADLFIHTEADAQTMSLGGNGTALTGSASSVFYNSAQAGLSEKQFGIQYSFSPWQCHNYTQKKLWLHQASGFCHLNKKQSILAGIRYVRLDDILLTDENGNSIGKLRSYGMEANMGYALRLFKNLSAGITTRYYRFSQDAHDKDLFAADLSVFYNHKENSSYLWQAGCQLSNIGQKSLPLRIQYGLSGEYHSEHHYLMLTAGMTHQETFKGYHHLANAGVKYTYNDCLTFRCGYKSGNKNKGIYSYVALGGGVTFFNLCLDASYKFTSSQSLNNKEWLLSLSYSL